MKKYLKRLVPVLCTGAFIVSGCAKQQTVKADQPIAPSATTREAAPAQSQKPALSQQSSPSNAGLAGSAIKAEPLQSSAGEIKKEGMVAGALEKIYFDFDSDLLSDAARKTLTENAVKLKASPSLKIRVEGNCDERGSDEYNLALSERRAQAAVKYLTALGVPGTRLSAIGYGEEKPADSGHGDDAWAKNRRDEFAISK